MRIYLSATFYLLARLPTIPRPPNFLRLRRPFFFLKMRVPATLVSGGGMMPCWSSDLGVAEVVAAELELISRLSQAPTTPETPAPMT